MSTKRLLRSIVVVVAVLTAAAAVSIGQARLQSPEPAGSGSKGANRFIQLVIEDNLLAAIGARIPADFRVVPRSKLDSVALLNAISTGHSMVWIGEASAIPPDLWIGAFVPAKSPLSITSAGSSPVQWKSLGFRNSQLSSAYIKPTKRLPYHNVDEEPRAEFLPLLEAHDRFGQVVGYPGVLMQYYAPSSVVHRFEGSECFFFLFDRPTEAMDVAGWSQLLEQLASRFRAQLQIKRVTTSYASYRLGERVVVRAEVANWRPRAATTEMRLYAKAPGEKGFREIVKQRRCPDALSNAEATLDFVPRGAPGLWVLRVEAWQDPVHAEELAIAGDPVLVDTRDLGVVMLDGELKTPVILSLNGPSMRLEGQDGFWIGTNYTPSSAWWDWQWRDFRPLKVAGDFVAMRRTGYRIVRDWVDPVLDEQSLRAMDAAIYLGAQNGLLLDLCVFSQWTRTLGFERENGQHVSFDFRGRTDFNILGISFRDLALQKELIQILAKRWRGAGNLIYNLSNETYIKDPDPTQMDKEVTQWQGIPREYGVLRDSLLVRKWANEMAGAIRQAKGTQPIIPGWMLTSAGSSRTGRIAANNYLANRDGEIDSWHHYDEPESAALTLSYLDPACSGRPILLEEFGATDKWADRLNDEKRYDAIAHTALSAGAAGAMSYEWGVSWLSPDLAFFATPRREAQDLRSDRRWRLFLDFDREKSWSGRTPGLFPAPSGFNWGTIYHGTPFPADTAIVLGRLGRIGQGLGRARSSEKVYVVVPTPQNIASVDPGQLPSALGLMAEVSQTIKKLSEDKVIFGILQEDCLGNLPKSARIIIRPKELGPASGEKLGELRRTGVQVFTAADDSWRRSGHLPRVEIVPNEGTDLMVRRTTNGTLYTLRNLNQVKSASLKTERNATVSMGLNDFALVHENAAGINLVEASDEVTVRGKRLCTIERGRAILASDDGQDLLQTKRFSLLATEPTRITFDRPIRSVAVLDRQGSSPVGTVSELTGKSSVVIDGELIRYVLRIESQ